MTMNDDSSDQWTVLTQWLIMTKKQVDSETKAYILTKAVGMTYGDNGPLFT